MPIYKPSELRQFLDQLGVHPKKRLSQNFLIDGNILRKIVQTAQLSSEDLVVEIGPGPGSLTEELLKTDASVIGIEKDPIFASALERLKAPGTRLDIYCEDILSFPLESVVRAKLPQGRKAKVIANLPYHLTTPIIAMLVKQRELFSTLILMVQEEVARRFIAEPKTSAYSSFTVFLNFYSRPAYAFTVNRKCFYPAPKVDSAVVILDLKAPPKVVDEAAFFELTRKTFEQRRKMLRSSLRQIYPPQDIENALTEIGQNPLARPEELSLDDFLKLFDFINKNLKKI